MGMTVEATVATVVADAAVIGKFPTIERRI